MKDIQILKDGELRSDEKKVLSQFLHHPQTICHAARRLKEKLGYTFTSHQAKLFKMKGRYLKKCGEKKGRSGRSVGIYKLTDLAKEKLDD